ncbi:CarD family transcriptional regulator [Peribacillus deserti]|uniref:Transcription factor YdeB n=1 Tax=Peribacillus deserti TaxID=673318 RepID=A0A2N5M7U1_9BACI|nr:CarD family transcriptional regulator [Peribacillus deserti]PLT30363.1 transcription factor YdeB [Peribacillus deserti]
MEVDSLFQVGDNIVYPMQGVGVIQAVEEKEILGKKELYFIISFPVNDMQLMIPESKISTSGIRSVAGSPALDEVLNIFKNGERDTSLSWKQRYKTNMDKMRTGELLEGAEVVRDLMLVSREKALNPSEKQMLEKARKYLLSELRFIKGISKNQAAELLNAAL